MREGWESCRPVFYPVFYSKGYERPFQRNSYYDQERVTVLSCGEIGSSVLMSAT